MAASRYIKKILETGGTDDRVYEYVCGYELEFNPSTLVACKYFPHFLVLRAPPELQYFSSALPRRNPQHGFPMPFIIGANQKFAQPRRLFAIIFAQF